MSYSFRCRDTGHACGWEARGGSQEEVLAKVTDHVRRVHRVRQVTQTIANYAKSNIRQD